MRHPLGLGCLTRESALASIWFAKNAPHRIINVGGVKFGWVGLVQNTPPPRFPPFFPVFPPFFPVFPRFSPFSPVFPCYWEPNADWVWEPWTPDMDLEACLKPPKIPRYALSRVQWYPKKPNCTAEKPVKSPNVVVPPRGATNPPKMYQSPPPPQMSPVENAQKCTMVQNKKGGWG